MECIFCRIIKGEIPCYKVYEDDGFLGFLDIKPLNKGHCLIIPKEHYRWVWDVPDIGGYYKAVRAVADGIRKAFSIEMVASIVLGEEVPHAHVWLVPRFPGDGHGSALNFSLRKSLPEDEMRQIAEKISDSVMKKK